MAVVKTKVDDLLELLKKEGKVSISDASKKLKIPVETLQAWVDFMIEEGIIGMEYKFTTPYIYLNKVPKENIVKEEEVSLADFKKEYLKKAEKAGITGDEALTRWKKHLLEIVESRKNYFMEECRKFGLEDAEKAFNDYKQGVLQ